MAQKKQTIQFEQNDKLFKALIENSWDVVLLIDKKARVVYASPSIVRMFGRDFHEFTGVSGIKYIHPVDSPRVGKALAQIILNPGEPIHMEMRIRHKLGHYLWIEALATNFLTDKNINGIVINFHDITELKKIDERKDEFISVASHELKTPITSLKVYLQLFRKNFQTFSPSKAEDFLDKMFSQVQKLERFVNDIYDAARIREGKLSLSKEKFKMVSLIKETADDIERNYGTHRIIFFYKI
jgi:PAS domain S-box-containing protein